MTAHVDLSSLPFVPLNTQGSESQIIFASGLGLTPQEPSLEQICDLLMKTGTAEIAFPSSLILREDFFEILGLLHELQKTPRLVVQVGFDLSLVLERLKGYESNFALDLIFDREMADWSFLNSVQSFREARLVLAVTPLFDWRAALRSVPDQFRSNMQINFLQSPRLLNAVFSDDEIMVQTHEAQQIFAEQGWHYQQLTYLPRNLFHQSTKDLDFYEEPSVLNYRKDILLLGAFSYYSRWSLKQVSWWFQTLPRRAYRAVFVFLLRCRDFYMAGPHRSYHTFRPMIVSSYWRARHLIAVNSLKVYWQTRRFVAAYSTQMYWRTRYLIVGHGTKLFWDCRYLFVRLYWDLRYLVIRSYYPIRGSFFQAYHNARSAIGIANRKFLPIRLALLKPYFFVRYQIDQRLAPFLEGNKKP